MILHSDRGCNDCILRCHCIQIMHSYIYSAKQKVVQNSLGSPPAHNSPCVNLVGLNVSLFVTSLRAFVISTSHWVRLGKMGTSTFCKIKVSFPPFLIAPNPPVQQRTPMCRGLQYLNWIAHRKF